MSRSPQDYAIEHAEYMAQAAEQAIEAINARDALLLRREESDDVADDDLYDSASTAGSRIATLKSCIAEFRKRRDRTTSALQAFANAAPGEGLAAVRAHHEIEAVIARLGEPQA